MRWKILWFLVILNTLPASATSIDTLLIFSKAMNKEVPNIVIYPSKMNPEQEKPLSVIYLLHGADGSYTDSVTKVPELLEYADRYHLIIVCPDGGHNSWYFDSPFDKEMQYETYISKELIDFIDLNYPTINDRKGRAIAGLSMGGHGAFYLAFRHQEVYGAAGSMSGGLDLIPYPDGWDIKKRLGEYALYPENWEKNTLINMVSYLENDFLKLIMDCGIDDFFFDSNQRMHKALVDNKIPHDYIERSGAHNWEYWANSIQYQTVF
ncbi:MAG: esterase family protein [Flammeovirgaceae bacterium]|nr:esterase family protein [Flammeovirgaceae bacterium]